MPCSTWRLFGNLRLAVIEVVAHDNVSCALNKGIWCEEECGREVWYGTAPYVEKFFFPTPPKIPCELTVDMAIVVLQFSHLGTQQLFLKAYGILNSL